MTSATTLALARGVSPPPSQLVSLLPVPVLVVGPGGHLTYANPAAEQMFQASARALLTQTIEEVVPFGSPLLGLIGQARKRGTSIVEHDVDLSTPRLGAVVADITVTPMPEFGEVILLLQERGLTQRIDRQLLHRGAARSVGGMSAVLAHEIKNPLAGIRGAAQLLEDTVPDAERGLTHLIRDEADRIRALIERMEDFGKPASLAYAPVNIHEVLARVRQVAETGFARGIRIAEAYDPSLPPVPGDRDQLIQAFLNIMRNAADACAGEGGEIVLGTAYRHGVRVTSPGAATCLNLPLEVTVRDNGRGVDAGLLPEIFQPFVTTKAHGTGLGLALVAKIVGDHGGIVECESQARRTVFRVLLPVVSSEA